MGKYLATFVIQFFFVLGIIQEVKAQDGYSFPLPSNADGWYMVAWVGGQHASIEYSYSHPSSNNPSISTGEIQFVNV